jgi:translocation and assembly module TamB
MARLRILFHLTGGSLSLVLSGTFSLLVALLLGLAFWLQTEGSLAHVLRMVGAALPAGQSLQASGVTGSAKSGGHIEHLVWRKGELAVEALGLEMAWDWHGLLEGELRVNSLHARSLQVTDRNPASGSPFSELPLPLRANVLFSLDRLDWAGPPAWAVEAMRGHYRFDGTTHRLQDVHLRMADGSYEVHAELQALQPMALTVQVRGEVQAPVEIKQAPLLLEAKASAHGTLLGPDAVLDVAIDLQPQGNAGSRSLGSMQATLQATLRPAEAQPLARAQGQWTAFNLASLWPQAPRTSLSGQVQVLPEGAGWKGKIQVQNNAPGPLDQQRLPLDSVQGSLNYLNGQWLLSTLQAHGAGGTLQAQGKYDASPARWSVTGTLQGLQSHQLDSRWPAATLEGKLAAKQTPQGIVFETQLMAPLVANGAAKSLRLEATGIWSQPWLQLNSLLLQTPQAQISGQLQVDTRSYASTGQLRADLPGAHVALDGNLAAATGQGSSVWQVRDVQALSRWLQDLPVVGAAFAPFEAQGELDLAAHWSGGWQNLTAGLQFSGKAQSGLRQLSLAADSQIALLSAGHWQARVDALNFSAAEGTQTKPWTLQLQQPLTLDWQHSALIRTLSVAAGSMRLIGPVPGTAQVEWPGAQWSQTVAAGLATAAPRWKTRGQMQGVPLAWLELLGQTRIANLGLRGDLVFGGQWDASMDGSANGLQVRAKLQRSSGDLQLLSVDANGTLLQAGLRDAHVDLQVNGNALQANFVWASDAGGNAQADFATQLGSPDSAWTWATDAPLRAKVHANLPRVGAWSLFAPVGWRINGTLEADMQLSGTRSQPVWKGSLLARDMSVRSAVEGVDFSNGLLRLQIDGQHMDIAELTLQGAGGAAGGQLLATGSVDWLPGAPDSPMVSRLRLALDAKAQALRVTSRPDQRLVVSGNLAARLIDTRLVLRGVLLADQALFVLPEDNTPRLGSDVRVKRGKPLAGKADPAPERPPSQVVQPLLPDLSIVLDPGPNFQVQGHGIKTRLTGLLTLQAEGRNASPRLTGELHTASGTYRAYGQSLRIEDGTLRFTGAYDNPTLDIRAVRPNLSQVVGVEVSGTAQLPVVRLYSEPDLPDAEKPSWLVLGRSSANGGAETAMLQQAALALLAGRGVAPSEGIGKAFGLDEVSLGQIATTNLDGSTGTEATVRLGKRISRDFYVAYERGLAGTLGTFYVFYDLSRRFTLRGESGTQNALDLIFTTRFD